MPLASYWSPTALKRPDRSKQRHCLQLSLKVFTQIYKLSIVLDLPPLDDMRLALLGPRVRRTLYRQDRIPDDSDDKSVKDYNLVSQNLEILAINDNDCEIKSKNDQTTKNPSPIQSKSPRPQRISRRLLFSVSEASTNYAIRQPRCPGDGKGFKKERSIKINDSGLL